MGSFAKAAILATALGLIAGAAPASAVVAYTTQTSTGASIVPGTTDIGNHGDDTTTTISFPFPVSFYGQNFNGGVVSSNGNLQFATTATDFTNSCLPAANLGASIMPYWDDLYLVNSGFGIFTSVTGVAPHRTFNIEWRAQFFPGSGNSNFEIQLHEDSPIITVIYGTLTNGSTSATAGVQASATGPFTQFSCNTAATLTSGLRVDYIPNAKTLTAAKGGTGAGTVTSGDGRLNCGTTCSATFGEGTAVTLTATPAAGSTFAGWSGGGCSGTGDCTTTMDTDKTVTATFDVVPPLDTKIDKAKINQDKNSATFRFEALTATSGFQCALVKNKHATPRFKACKSPKRYKHLKPHRYLFEVRAFDPTGMDATPAKRWFRIK